MKNNQPTYMTIDNEGKKTERLSNNISLYVDTQARIEKLIYKKFEKNESNNYEYCTGKTIILTNIVGNLICDFLNCNFEDIARIEEFIKRYSFTFLSGIARVELMNTYTPKQYQDVLTSIGRNISKIQDKFKHDINYIYNIHKFEKLNELTVKQRLLKIMNTDISKIISKIYDSNAVSIDLRMNIFEEDNDFSFSNEIVKQFMKDENIIPYTFNSSDLAQILILELKEMSSIDKFAIKRCQNCGKYFVPEKRTDELYCNNVFEDTGKTCKDIGFFLYSQRLIKSDEVKRLYRNTYQQKLLRVKRNPDNEEYAKDFDNFREEYSVIKEKLNNGKMTQEEFKKWLEKKKKD